MRCDAAKKVNGKSFMRLLLWHDCRISITSLSKSEEVCSSRGKLDGKTGRDYCTLFAAACPQGHPHAYLTGTHCCLHDSEKADDGTIVGCRGRSPIEITSTCCLGEEFVRCPNNRADCTSYNP